jgi:hypothetical protein
MHILVVIFGGIVLALLFYACIAKTKKGGRCQKDAEIEGRCLDHPIAQRADLPDSVEFQLHINPKQSHRLEAAGTSRAVGYETPQAGIRVFGTHGLARVKIFPAIQEMVQKGYALDSFFIMQRDDRMDILSITLSRDGPVKEIPPELTWFFEVNWGHCRVWAYPFNGDKKIVHIVNCAHQLSFSPMYNLFFEDGLWGAQEL